MEFNVGDRVKCVSRYLDVYDKMGTVMAIGYTSFGRDDRDIVHVAWDDNAKSELHFTHLELIKPARPKVKERVINDYFYEFVYVLKIIYVGRKTILLYKDHLGDKKVRRAIAKCSPDDKYDRIYGEGIAFNRAIIAKMERELAKLTK